MDAGRDDAESKLYDVAERQARYVTAAQALDAGDSRTSQSYHDKAGNWLRDGWGVYRLAHFPNVAGAGFVRLMPWNRDRAGVVQTFVSHASALAAHGLSDVLPHEMHVTVPKRFRKEPPDGVVLHRADLKQDDVRERDGYGVAAPLRTLLDVAASPLSVEHLEAAASGALERGSVRRRASARSSGSSIVELTGVRRRVSHGNTPPPR
jgi:predicted transcriptional regulator of viral defense system